MLVEHSGRRFEEDVLTLADPDGMKLELVGTADAIAYTHAPRTADVPPEHSIRGFSGVTMLMRDATATAGTLAWMGFAKIAEEGNRLRFAAPNSTAMGNHVDVVVDAAAAYGRSGRWIGASHRVPHTE